MPQLIIRADATKRVGAGHVMRCATVADAWQQSSFGTATFVGQIDLPFALDRLRAAGIEVQETATWQADSVLVVDTYDQSERERLSRVPATIRVLVDDLGCAVPSGYSVVLNPNAYATADLYPSLNGYFIGGRNHVPIRSLPKWSPDNTRAVAIGIGATFPAPILLEALVMLQRSGTRFVASGDWVPADWERAEAGATWQTFSNCDRILSAAGTTLWEAAAVQIPTAVIQIADNQDLIAAWASEHGLPVVTAKDYSTAAALASALASALEHATVPPFLANGAESIASALFARAAQQ